MTRAEMIRALLANLPTGSDSVSYPDHPLLLRGPDVLATYRNSLTAYFVMARSTQNSINQMLSTALLSRLALPLGTRLVFVVAEATRLAEEASWLFEETVEAGRNKNLRVPVDPLPISGVAEVFEALRNPHHDRFAEAWAPTTRGRRFTRRTPGEPTSLRGLTREAISHESGGPPELEDSDSIAQPGPQYLAFDNGIFYFRPPGALAASRLSRLTSDAAATAVSVDYGLEFGFQGLVDVADLVRSQDAHLALHHGEIPIESHEVPFDATKPLRAAAFAGFAPY